MRSWSIKSSSTHLRNPTCRLAATTLAILFVGTTLSSCGVATSSAKSTLTSNKTLNSLEVMSLEHTLSGIGLGMSRSPSGIVEGKPQFVVPITGIRYALQPLYDAASNQRTFSVVLYSLGASRHPKLSEILVYGDFLNQRTWKTLPIAVTATSVKGVNLGGAMEPINSAGNTLSSWFRSLSSRRFMICTTAPKMSKTGPASSDTPVLLKFVFQFTGSHYILANQAFTPIVAGEKVSNACTN